MTIYSTFRYDILKKSLIETYSEKIIEVDGVRQIQTLKVILKT